MHETGTILDHHAKQNPRPWWRKQPKPTALELAAASLEETRRERLEHSDKAEYHTAMVKMLVEREKRLGREIAALSSKKQAKPELEGVDLTHDIRP